MSRFQEYLVEMTMDYKTAIKTLGVDDDMVADKAALKKHYRKLAMQHHPDHGGDEETFKHIDAAYKHLSDTKVTGGGSLSKWKEHDKKSREMAEQVKQALLSDFQPELYQRYFNEHSGYTFFYEITKTHKQWPGFEVEFFTKDRKTVFHLKISASINDVMRGGLGGGGLSYTVYTEAHGFHLKKKQKMSKSDWGFTNDHSFLKKPEKLFPPKKMKDIFSGATSNRKFAKRDMITYLKTKLKADWDGKDYARIPLGDGYILTIFRSVFMRKGNWGVNGIYLRKGKYGSSRVSQPRFVSFMEEEITAEIFDKIQKEVMKVSGEAKIKKTEKLLAQAYEIYKKSKGI